MSDADRRIKTLSRRELIRRASLALAGAGFVPVSGLAQQGQPHRHAAARTSPTGPYQRKYFTEHEFKTLQVLSDWIIPPDEKSQGGIAGGTAELIDLIAGFEEDLQISFSGGLAWLDARMRGETGESFIEASREQQKQMLDLLAYRKNESPELAPGITFFSLMRDWTVDAFYSSREGIADLGFQGNQALSEWNGCGEDVVRQLLEKSPV